MKNIFTKTTALITGSLLTPMLVFAQQFDADGGEFGVFLTNILGFINAILIPFILGIGFLVFVWGMFKFFIYGGANDESKESGKSLMVYATLGFVLIIIFWGVVNLIANATGFENRDLQNIPEAIPVSALQSNAGVTTPNSGPR